MSFLKRFIIRDSIIPFELQNRTNWSILLNQYDDVPVNFKVFYEPFVKADKPFPYSVFTPSYDILGAHSTEKLVCLTDHKLFIVNKKETFEKSLKFSFDKIQHIQFRSVLLDSNLSITGTDDQGEPNSTEVRFNTVSEYLFRKIVEMIRQKSFSGAVNHEPFSFDKFRAVNFKFANFAQHCLIPGEKVIQLIWQPELLHSFFHIHIPLFSHAFYPRRIFPNHLLMLTDQELIHISEDTQNSHLDCYGGKWDYIPLEKIRNTALNLDQNGIITLSIELPDNQRLETRYLPTLGAELDKLVNHIKSDYFIPTQL